jgi:hypothetical protein
VLGLTASLVAGCSFRPAEGGPSQAVADAIRASGSNLIDNVYYEPANILDPSVIRVYLKTGTTDAEADALWCAVVIPAAGSADAAELSRVSLSNNSGTDSLGSAAPEC